MPITRAYASAAQPGNAFLAGKNKIINGDFSINQRNFTSTTTQGAFGFDRFAMDISANTCTYSAQVFTPGAAPVAGYEATNYARCATTGQDATSGYSIIWQRIEDARTFAGQTATFSLWAKANTGTPKIAVEFVQKFGSGGSAEVQTYAGQITLSTSWARYSITVAIPSVSGKTIGSGSCLAVNLWLSAGSTYNSRTNSLGVQNNTLDLWGWQLEAGAVATPFTTATGTLAGELAACKRYYWRRTGAQYLGTGYAQSSTWGDFVIQYDQMRAAPTLSANTGTNYFNYQIYGVDGLSTTIGAFYSVSAWSCLARTTTSSLTAGAAGRGGIENASGYLEASAEL